MPWFRRTFEVVAKCFGQREDGIAMVESEPQNIDAKETAVLRFHEQQGLLMFEGMRASLGRGIAAGSRDKLGVRNHGEACLSHGLNEIRPYS